MNTTEKYLYNVKIFTKICSLHLPRLAGTLHDVGECDVVGPHVELPLPEAEHAAVDPATSPVTIPAPPSNLQLMTFNNEMRS